MTTYFRLILFSILVFFTGVFFGQTNTATPDNEDGIPKKVIETKLSEVITIPDSVAASELLKRAVNWVKLESTRYIKTGGSTTASKIECNITFFTKPKELNPEVDYSGKITMKVSIECKDSKYRYTVSQIRHTSKAGQTTGGSVDNVVPECGRMAMGENVWRKLKSEAIKDANLVVSELKITMEKPATEATTEEW